MEENSREKRVVKYVLGFADDDMDSLMICGIYSTADGLRFAPCNTFKHFACIDGRVLTYYSDKTKCIFARSVERIIFKGIFNARYII